MQTTKGSLFIVATPIGNLGDITFRAVEVLRAAAVVACEDTRRSRVLFTHLGIVAPRLVSCFEHNEQHRIPGILATLDEGKDAALITDAGTPNISDPGYRLVKACVDGGYRVIPIPGACAAIAAISASGLPTDRFSYMGFPPVKKGRFEAFIDEALLPERTAVFYLPMRRVPATLELIAGKFPATRVVIARELTKLHEEFIRGTAGELLAALPTLSTKGECTFLCHRDE
jgi:16S rRNA (cytidine1402-2'-O)-methyltransferase